MPALAAGETHCAMSSLRVGGLVPLTTIDYPGELAAVIFCQGCPWRCRYCQNAELIDPDASSLIPWADCLDFLRRRRGLLDAVVFSGGEPTLQGALAQAMREARGLGFKIGLHTAGIYPGRLAKLIHLLDWVALDIKALPADYPAITGVPGSGEAAWQSLSLLQRSGIELEVRTTLMPGWGPDDLGAIAAELARCGVRHYVVQACNREHVLDPTLPARTTPVETMAANIDPADFACFSLRGH